MELGAGKYNKRQIVLLIISGSKLKQYKIDKLNELISDSGFINYSNNSELIGEI